MTASPTLRVKHLKRLLDGFDDELPIVLYDPEFDVAFPAGSVKEVYLSPKRDGFNLSSEPTGTKAILIDDFLPPELAKALGL